jgi:hypothetical protein
VNTSYVLSNNTLIPVASANADRPNPGIPVLGLGTGENLVGIDFRPQNGKLYGLTTNGVGGVRLYVISVQTGVATPLTAAPVQFDDGAGNPVPILGTNFGLDFNPTVDRLRVVTDGGFNFRINPNTGTLIDGNNNSPTPVPGVNPDGQVNLNGNPALVDATAYTNNAPNVTATTQYTLDAVSNRLFIQSPPNSGSQINALPVTLNGAPLDFTAVNGFDIPAGINVATSNSPATGQALAALTVNGKTGLYGIELSTGAATLLNPIAAGNQPVQGFSVQSEPVPKGVPLIAVDAGGTTLLRFNSASPSSITSVSISGVPTGEKIVGIDIRPATGQLYALSVNAASNTGSLLLLDPQLGTATPVGTPGQIAFVNAAGNPLDLPDSGFGIDFNPTVDRLRVVTSSGLNFRINPITGAPVDSDPAIAGTNPDGNINVNGAAAAADATAYTNSFGGATVTTQYTLDAATNQLSIQSPPNSGTQINRLPVTLNGAPLDFTNVNGFDIPSGVQVGTANAPAQGRGFAALTVGGNTNLYAIELSTGAATLLGPVAGGIGGLTVADAPSGTVAFGKATYTVAENGKSIAIDLVRTGGTTGAVTVNLAATGGTATANSDFNGLPTTVTFADGQTTATATINIVNDQLQEGDETVMLSLSNPTNSAVLDAQDQAILAITDDERVITGTNRAETLLGGPGNDVIVGLGGNDRLLGFSGNDTLIGGMGSDRLAGGAGADRFVYAGNNQRAAFSNSLLAAPDQIVQFNAPQGDRFQLDFDANPATVDRPRQVFNAGAVPGNRLIDAVQSAFADKDQRQSGKQALQANEAVFFSMRNQTYLAVNDNQASFSANRDLIVNVTGINFIRGDAQAGSLVVANYFV